LQETIMLMRKSHKEYKDTNKKLIKDVEDLQQKLATAVIVEQNDTAAASLDVSVMPSQKIVIDDASSIHENHHQSTAAGATVDEDGDSEIHLRTSSDSTENELWC
jgi:hypothetical protein